MTLQQKHLGVDISKARLDLFDSVGNRASSVPNTAAAVKKLIKTFPAHVFVFEATSACDHLLRQQLTSTGVPFMRVNPRRAREFARACGFLAKTDRVDATMLAEMGRRLELPLTLEPSPARQKLAALVHRREHLVGDIVAQKNRLQQVQYADIAKDIERHLRWLTRERDKIDAKIADHVKAHNELVEAEALVRTAPGIGPVVAATLVAEMPELGRRDRRSIAALAGLAPLANDSGRFNGKRKIWGGRARVRRALFIAALHASRRCPHMKAMRERMAAAGKAPKIILVAIARKLLVALNAMIRDNTTYQAPEVT